MTPAVFALLRFLTGTAELRRALQRWALRYAARQLRKLGPLHEVSADVLQAIGETPPAAARAVTRTGISPRGLRRPHASPQLPQLHRDAGATRPYLTEGEP